MNRCTSFIFGLCALGLLASGGMAQTGPSSQNISTPEGVVASVRTFPAQAVRASLVVQAPPEVLLNGKADRLSPGARIRGANGMLVLSASLVGQTLAVMVTREPSGMLHNVWVLTELEAQRIPAKPSFSQ